MDATTITENHPQTKIYGSDQLSTIRAVKGCLAEIIRCLDDEGSVEVEEAQDSELMDIYEELTSIASVAKSKVKEFKEKKKNERKQLESSTIVSLTEENGDINNLLRVALLEKAAVENKVKGNTEQKRMALLQIAEMGLQRVGFGFLMGSGRTALSGESWGATTAPASTTASVKSDGSDYEEEVISLASTVERIMKNLRREINQLRRSLEESRSDAQRLQSLTEKQAQQIADNKMYIKELEDKETVFVQNVDELLIVIKETEADAARWREACELEVEAGKYQIQELDKLVGIMKLELEKTKAALEISNGKLKLKEELANAAMAAQAAAEKSLQLADSRSVVLQQRVEELRRQLEEAESRERSRRKVRHICCWPWRARMVPEMQPLLHHSL
ncbi:uncharacterized protein At3g49055 [Mercurialis annua]|uniref:uncharacterized protein At3g49055 n=1 Tax=Mercurialis annua TaxID=3986 RepID=UPI00215E1977|nr:uncharacterized protein At3g49055 [Mercurialis annua]